MIEQASSSVRCLLLPLHRGVLVVPANLVKEVHYEQVPVEEQANAPAWLLGQIRQTSGESVPLICFDTLTGRMPPAVSGRGHTVILRSLRSQPDVPLYALRVTRVPRVELLDSAQLQVAEDAQSSSFIACHVMLDGIPAVVPELDEIAHLLDTTVGQQAPA